MFDSTPTTSTPAILDRIHAEKYRDPGQSREEHANTLAESLSSNAKHKAALFDIFMNDRFLPAGRVQAAGGSSRNSSFFNCIVSGTIEDSMYSIVDKLKEALLTLRLGSGIGYDFSKLRPQGAFINTLKSAASGPLSFMDVFNAACKTIHMSHRRGAQMGVMRVDHPDIIDFINAKLENRLSAFNLSVAVTDEFMRCLDTDCPFPLAHEGKIYKHVNANELWDRLTTNAYISAEPGMLFIDTINKNNNLSYCEDIAATNPCFSGSTLVWTADGPKRFDALTGTDTRVLTQTDKGKLVFRTMRNIRVTQRNAQLVRVKLDDGTEIKCTPEHKFYLKDGTAKEAKDLGLKDSIQSVYKYRANSKGYMRISNGVESALEHRVPFDAILDGYHVHHINGIKDDNGECNLQLLPASEHMSIHMSITNKSGKIPHDARNANYGLANGRYRCDIDDIVLAESLGCSKYTVMQRLGWERPSNHKIVSVEHIEDREDVYCGTVDETGKFYIVCEEGGVLVSNCGEQPLPPYGACLLGSFNLTAYLRPKRLEWDFDQFHIDIRHIVEAYDNIFERSIYALPQHREEATSKRRIGLGITGIANAIELMLGRPCYGEPAFNSEFRNIAEFLRNSAYGASIRLAAERGPFAMYAKEKYMASPFIQSLPDYTIKQMEKHGIRNSHLISYAPCGTISLAHGNLSSGIEPVFYPTTKRKIIMDGGVTETHTVSDYAVQKYGFTGKTLDRCTTEDHLAVHEIAQRYCDSAVSKTINMPATTTLVEYQSVWRDAYNRGAKGLTVYRSNEVRPPIISSGDCDNGECKI